MMSQRLEYIINQAIKKANELKHEYLTLEDMLFAMLDDEQVKEVLVQLGVNTEELRVELESFMKNHENFSVLTDEEIEELSKKQFVDEDLRKMARESGIFYQPEISLALQRVIQRAAMHVQSAGKRHILGINILVAMFHEKDSYALHALMKRGVEKFDVVKLISHGLDRPQTEDQNPVALQDDGEGGPAPRRQKGEGALDQYAINLNHLAEEGQIDPLIGREEELERIVQILCRRRKNNPLLVGEAGVGKTAIAEGLARAIVENKVPEVLKGVTIYALDMAGILAGAKFRGDFEQRLKQVIQELESLAKKGPTPILFIDEMHTVMGAGSTTGSSMDASNLLKPALSSGKIRVLGSTTHEEFRKFIEKDSAFSRRFQKVDVDEPSADDTYKILMGLRPKFEEHHNVKFPNTVLKSAVDLAERYLTDRKNPDKAIDVIDEAGAMMHLLPESKRRGSITKKDIEEVVAKLAKIPKISVASTEKDKLKNLKQNLLHVIYGQDHAVEQVADAILMSRSGLGHEGKPIASFLFAGPTGVGKTELARQLAFIMGSHLERFDMSEYMEKHAVSKLIGAPPGYVGHEQGGQLTDAIKKNPHTILLLDEIEKAHPDIYNILLQVLDHGKLTDAQGRTTDFRNVVIIMTTNAGAQDMEVGSIGLASATSQVGSSRRDQVIKNTFSPEFRNRLDGIIHFNKLGEDFIVKIVEKFLIDLEMKLAVKNVRFEATEAAKLHLARVGHDPKMGARPLARLIDAEIKKPLSHEVLFGVLAKGGHVIVDFDEMKSKIIFRYEN
ncbi:MAG: ATP-dependent Clp protease ATP-binding subunit ClpA [Bdellovibrio sp.]